MSQDKMDCSKGSQKALSDGASLTRTMRDQSTLPTRSRPNYGQQNILPKRGSPSGQEQLFSAINYIPKPAAMAHMTTSTIPSSSNTGRPISSTSTTTPVFLQHNTSGNSQGDCMIIRRRPTRMTPNAVKTQSIKRKMSELQNQYLKKYLGADDGAEPSKLDLCNELISLDLPINSKYKELDLELLLRKNMVKQRITYITQALGILEKYASNLIKPNRPAFWRTVKFTSSLVKTYLESMYGSHEILKQMGYTKHIPDGLCFPDEVFAPDVEKTKILAADLFLAKVEIEDLVNDRHPYFRVEKKKERVSSTAAITQHANSALGSGVETSDGSESEYEDAEDGLSSPEQLLQDISSTHAQAASPSEKVCHICGVNKVQFNCDECQDGFCPQCDSLFHQHQSRKNHIRKDVDKTPELFTGKSSLIYENQMLVKPLQTRTLVADSMKNKARKPPIPTPRRNLSTRPTRTTSVESMRSEANTTSSKGAGDVHVAEELPRPPEVRRTGRLQTNQGIVPQLPTGHTAERRVLRPPPLDYTYTPRAQSATMDLPDREKDEDSHIYESLDVTGEHIYEKLDSRTLEQESPPPLPPRMQSEDDDMTIMRNPETVVSCPHCYCLNEKGVLACKVCQTALPRVVTRYIPKVPMPTGRTTIGPISNQSYPQRPDVWPGKGRDGSQSVHLDNPMYMQTQREILVGAPTRTRDIHSRTNDHGELRAFMEQRSQAPPASTPAEQAWRCEFCTFSNPISKNVCDMCFKTRTDDAAVVKPDVVPFLPHEAIKFQEKELESFKHTWTSERPSFIEDQVREEQYLKDKSQGKLSMMRQTVSQLGDPQHQTMLGTPPPRVESTLLLTSPPPSFRSAYYFSERQQELSDIAREIKETQESGEQFVKLLKKAEAEGFDPEELNIAYNISIEDHLGPIHWLKNEWFDRIQQVMVEYTKVSKKDDLGNISPEEARQALIDNTGYVKEAMDQCVAERKKKMAKVMESVIYARTDCIKALDDNDGNVEESIQQLQRMTFEPMLQRIYDSCLPDDVDEQQQHRNPAERQISTTQDDEMFEAIVSNQELDMDRRIRVMFAEQDCCSWGRAMTAVQLIDMKFQVSDSIEAAKAVGDLTRSLQFLQRECCLCFEKKPESQMVTMLNCQCRCCHECVSQYVKIVIHEQNIMKLVCPQCGEPKNLDDDVVANEYFNHLDIMIRRLVDQETHDLFQRKIRDRTLMKEPNFRWCSHCSSGFINEQPNIIKMACPNCRKYTCFKCKKQWEDQHAGITCEQFAAWKTANDPEAQANGLAEHLKQNGIECPNCKFRYDLAKGGCMHFKCGQCNHEFCSGCYQPFRQKNHCPVSPNCARRGLHAHHPRDCLFYLRDRDPEELKKLLDDHNVPYNTEPPQTQTRGEVNQAFEEDEAAAANMGRCKVMEQRENAAGQLEDTGCGKETPPGFAGLCRLHFTEYLVEQINAHLIDPVGICSTQDLQILLQRNDIQEPAKPERENDDAYHNRLVQFVQNKLPLPGKPPRRRVLDMEGHHVPPAPNADQIEQQIEQQDEQQDGVVNIEDILHPLLMDNDFDIEEDDYDQDLSDVGDGDDLSD